MWQSTNPALANGDIFHEQYGAVDAVKDETASVAGVINKTSILVGCAVVCGIGGYAAGQALGWTPMLVSMIVSMLIVLGFYFFLRGNPKLAVYFAIPYAVVQGFFLGALTGVLDMWLITAGITPAVTGAIGGGLAFQAFLITLSVAGAMVALYYTGIIRPTQMFISVVSVLTVGVFFTYMLGFILYLFGMHIPYLWLGSAFEGGYAPLIGLGLNLLILGLASMWLIIDFKLIDDNVRAGAPKYMEWYCAFGLMVTLAWIYFEAVKLAFRLAVLFANRE